MADDMGRPQWIVLGGLLTAANVALVWMFRFLPMYDYPIWLFEARILHELGMAGSAFSGSYRILISPVPNLGFLVPVLILGRLVPLEVAGKIFLSVCVAGFPWSFWYCVHRWSGSPDHALAWMGFPYSFNLFFFGGHAYLLGLIFSFLTIGYFLPRLERISRAQQFLLSLLLLVAYLIHALAFLIISVVLLGGLLYRAYRWRHAADVLLMILPSLVALAWYLAVSPSMPEAEVTWGPWTIGQSFFKPAFLLTKSYGIGAGLPLTVLNLAWVCFAVWLICSGIASAFAKGVLERHLLVAAILLLVLIVCLPDPYLGITQPGSRFTLPFLLVCALLVVKVKFSPGFIPLFLVVTLFVAAYNLSHFRKVDEQMSEFYDAYRESADLDSSFCVIRLDWPADSGVWDIGSASINPLWGVVYYAHLDGTGWGEIHETSFLHLREERWGRSFPFAGATPEELAAKVLAHVESLKVFKNMAIVGNNNAARAVVEALKHCGYKVQKNGEVWTILLRET